MSNFLFSSNNIKEFKGGKAVFPFLVPTAVLLIVLSALLKTVDQVFLIVSAVLFLTAGIAFLVFNKNKGGFLMCMVLLLFCIRSGSVINGDIHNSYTLDGRNDRINVTVTTSPIRMGDETYGYCSVKVNSSQKGFVKKGDKIQLFSDNVAGFEIGDVLETDVKLSAFEKEYAVSHYSEGTYLQANSDGNVVLKGKSKGIYGIAGKVRTYVRERVKSSCGNYHILLSIITGDRAYISDTLYDKVVNAGVSHVLVVSGMHLVLLVGGLERILSIFIKRNFIKEILILLFVLMMSVVCGMGMSILRAAVIYLFKAIYHLLSRRENSIHSLSLAVVFVILVHPYAYFSVSFGLSYAATFGILVLSGKINQWLEKRTGKGYLREKLNGAISVSLSAYIATLPICVYVFKTLSVVAIPVNVLLDIPANLMLTFCVLGLCFGFVPFIEKIFMFFADVLGEFFLKVVDFASGLSFATLKLKNTGILALLILILYATIFVVKNKKYRLLLKR